jgi:hypothetical protein
MKHEGIVVFARDNGRGRRGGEYTKMYCHPSWMGVNIAAVQLYPVKVETLRGVALSFRAANNHSH